MKRLCILLLICSLLLCGCKAETFTLSHSIIEADWRSGVEYPLIEVFTSAAELATYKNELTSALETLPDDHFTHNRNLVTALNRYTNRYFKNNILIIVTISASSGGDQYTVDEIIKTNQDLTIKIRKTNSGMTCDMAAWQFLLELDDSYATDPANINLILS